MYMHVCHAIHQSVCHFLRFVAKSFQRPSSHTLSVEERDLIWKFRYYLRNDRRALTKFVRSVNWEEIEEANQAVLLIR